MILSNILRRNYHRALKSPRLYYTNQHEFDMDAEHPRAIIYFIHGLGGAPGQVNLVIPTIKETLRAPFYLRAMHIPALDVMKPFVERYTQETADKIRTQIIADLEMLTRQFPQRKIIVAVSSHGMYDFVYAYPHLSKDLRERIILLWLACASDEYEQLAVKYRWTLKFLYNLTGFEEKGYQWIFSINHNRLCFINPETSTSFSYRTIKGEKITYLKRDIEMRFKCLGLQWTDPTNINYVRDYMAKQISGALPIADIKCYVLAALNDGYWHDPSKKNIAITVERYIDQHDISYADTSHLWCVMPPFIYPFLKRFFQKELVNL